MIREQLVTHTKRIYDGVNPCTSITVHETANKSVGANAQAHANLQTSGTVRQASWHITVDDTQAIRSYPDTAQCWHAGTDAGNRTSIAIEICVNSDGDYDRAFKNAAAVVAELRAKHNLPRSAVVEHHYWSGKNCPTQMRVSGRWEEFLNLTDNTSKEPVMSKMVNPVTGRVSSEWAKVRRNPATGVVTSHAGIDIAAPVGTLVYAAFAGVTTSVRTGSYNGDPRHGYGPKTGNHVLIKNSDGAYQYYGHLNTTGLRVGQRVTAGEVIGTVGNTGRVTGPHLHFETWSNSNINSNFNPRVLFNKYGVKPGASGGVQFRPAGSVKPHKKPAGKHVGNSKRNNKSIQKALKSHGYYKGVVDGQDGPLMKAAVRAFQKRHKLVQDGSWGPVSQAAWDKATKPKKKKRAAQPTNYANLRVDGDFGSVTIKAVQILMRAVKTYTRAVDGGWGKHSKIAVQQWLKNIGFYTRAVDGSFGKYSVVALQKFLVSKNLYKGVVDGDFGPMTVKAFQSYLNQQRG